ncbi:MAG: hypothetical protein IPJ26_17000 [Bacteroidetes bacterium]|nr:hypothetical protein [Bacteroidota bacterium]
MLNKNGFDIQTSRQIKERLKQHALIVRTDPNNSSYGFDHEEFYEFFLGIAIGNNILKNKIQDAKSLLKKSPLPFQASDSVVTRIESQTKSYEDLILKLDLIVKGENQFSYVKENAGNIVIRILSNEEIPNINIKNYELPTNSLLAIELNKITFEECHFQNTSLASSKISNCNFIRCQFDRLEMNHNTSFYSVKLIDCEISTVYDSAKEKGYYEKYSIELFLKGKGIEIKRTNNEPELISIEVIDDEKIELTEKALRRYVRSNTPISEAIFKMRLGPNANLFFRKSSQTC